MCSPIRIVIGDILPVHVSWAERHAALGDELFHPIRRQLMGVGRRHFLYGRQAGLEADENESRKISCSRYQSVPAEVEAFEGFSLRNGDQAAVQAVCPGVVGAGD